MLRFKFLFCLFVGVFVSGGVVFSHAQSSGSVVYSQPSAQNTRALNQATNTLAYPQTSQAYESQTYENQVNDQGTYGFFPAPQPGIPRLPEQELGYWSSSQAVVVFPRESAKQKREERWLLEQHKANSPYKVIDPNQSNLRLRQRKIEAGMPQDVEQPFFVYNYDDNNVYDDNVDAHPQGTNYRRGKAASRANAPLQQHQSASLPPEQEREEMEVERSRQRTLHPKFERQVINYDGKAQPGTVVIDTPNRFLYLVLPDNKAIRYGIGVGRPGFEWAGLRKISQKREWPSWTPPREMLKRRPDLPTFMPGGENNPLGARALYIGSSLYRIHGTNEPHTIGQAVSSGCIRMRNEDVIHLYNRVNVGTYVVVR